MLRQRNPLTRDPLSKLRRRVSGIPTNELVTWAGTSLNIIGRQVEHHFRAEENNVIDDAILAADALAEILREIQRRGLGSL